MTALHDFSSDELEYFEHQYPEDLGHVFALLGADVPLVIFTGATHPPHVRKWTEHFALIERKIYFLFCLFFHVLIDQSLHFTRQSDRLEIRLTTKHFIPQPKLLGILGMAHSNVSPFFLLVSATLWLDAEIDARHVIKHQGIPWCSRGRIHE